MSQIFYFGYLSLLKRNVNLSLYLLNSINPHCTDLWGSKNITIIQFEIILAASHTPETETLIIHTSYYYTQYHMCLTAVQKSFLKETLIIFFFYLNN